MHVKEAINAIYAPKGLTTLVDAISGGDINSINSQDAAGKSLEAAKIELEKSIESQLNCKSDAAYWGYEGDIAYWNTVVNILKAADLVGYDNLPDVDKPNTYGLVVMDACSEIERFGKSILDNAMRIRKAED